MTSSMSGSFLSRTGPPLVTAQSKGSSHCEKQQQPCQHDGGKEGVADCAGRRRTTSFRIYYETEYLLAFTLAVQETGIRPRHIVPRRPEQNGKVERSHRIDKEACWSHSTFDGVAYAAQTLRAWEHRYNHERPHQAIAYCAQQVTQVA